MFWYLSTKAVQIHTKWTTTSVPMIFQSSCSLLSFIHSHPLLWSTYPLCPQGEFRASIRTYWFCRMGVAQRSPYPQRSSLFCSKTSIVLTQGKFTSQLSLYFHLAYNIVQPALGQAGKRAGMCERLPTCLHACGLEKAAPSQPCSLLWKPICSALKVQIHTGLLWLFLVLWTRVSLTASH